MVSQNMLVQLQSRQEYRNIWHSDLLSTMINDFPYCCFAVWCAPCASYKLRKRALYDDMSRYTCCAGYMPCSGKCGESHCPEICLCAEVWFCFGNSVSSTRFLMQDEFNIQTTPCDNCIIGFMLFLQCVSCIFSCAAAITGCSELREASSILHIFSDLVYCSVCACMQTQHKIEMDKRDGKFDQLPVMRVPPVQQMSRIDQAYPPSVGYPPQPVYGQQPYGYPPPPQAKGYPSEGYPSTQGYPPSEEYPPPPKAEGYFSTQGYPPSEGHPPPPKAEGYPSAQVYPPSEEYSLLSKAEGYPPAQGYPPAVHPPPTYPPPAGYPPK